MNAELRRRIRISAGKADLVICPNCGASYNRGMTCCHECGHINANAPVVNPASGGQAQGTAEQQIAKMTEQTAAKLRKRQLKVIATTRGDRSAWAQKRHEAVKALKRAQSYRITQIVGFQCNSILERFRNDNYFRETKMDEGYDSDDMRAQDMLAASEGNSMAKFALSRDERLRAGMVKYKVRDEAGDIPIADHPDLRSAQEEQRILTRQAIYECRPSARSIHRRSHASRRWKLAKTSFKTPKLASQHNAHPTLKHHVLFFLLSTT